MSDLLLYEAVRIMNKKLVFLLNPNNLIPFESYPKAIKNGIQIIEIEKVVIQSRIVNCSLLRMFDDV